MLIRRNTSGHPQTKRKLMTTSTNHQLQQQYEEQLDKTTKRFRQLMESDKWTKQNMNSPVTVTVHPSPENTSHIVKGEAIVPNCTTAQFTQIIDTFDVTIRKRFDTLCEAVDLLKQYSTTRQVIRVAFSAPTFLVSGRDFIYIRETVVNERETLIVCCSPDDNDDPSFAQVKGFVRGKLKTTVWQFIENDDGTLYVCYLNHADYNGYVPNFLINLAVLDQPLVIERVVKLLDREIKKQ